MKRLLAILGIGLWISACGGTARVEGKSGGGDETEDRSGDSFGPDAGAGGGQIIPPTIVDPVGETDGGSQACQPATCKKAGAECGNVPDGCGGILNCGGCDDGYECGIVADNECTRLVDLCVPIDKGEACAGKECGKEGDGCGGTYNCGTCKDGEGCGVKEAFQCDVVLTSTSTTGCDAEIKSCAEVGATCGKIGNGCGGILDCDEEAGCAGGELCGLEDPNVCGTPPTCEPIEPEVACQGRCGIVSNGCGVEVNDGIIDCELAGFGCPEGQACGAGGVPNQCGNAEEACVKLTKDAACADVACGIAGDGCGGSYACGTCNGSARCRAGECVEPQCTAIPKTTACAGKDCGQVSDGCGGTYNCGSCDSGQVCGGSRPFECSATTGSCKPVSQEAACENKQCGYVYDGCGSALANRINCGDNHGGCEPGEYCGLAETYQCAAPPSDPSCSPTDDPCAGWECGTAIGCDGEPVVCDDTCKAGETCIGGIDGPAICEGGGGPGYEDDCVVCDAIPRGCSNPTDTKLRGRVITPGKHDNDSANQVGVPNAYVFILRHRDASELPAIEQGIPTNGEMACERCEDEDLGPVLVSTITDSHGNYTLAGNIPIDEDFLLVVKIGKWRRVEQVKLAAGRECQETQLAATKTRLPRTRSDGYNSGEGTNIPRIAVATGAIDAMECVFYKMGVNESEFVHPGSSGTAAGRIHMYRGGASNGYGGTLPGTPVNDSTLYGSKARVFSYDMLVLDCEGAQYNSNPPNSMQRGHVREYVNAGGRMFASHLRHEWFHGNGNQPYNADSPLATGLAPAADFDGQVTTTEPPGRGYLHDVAGHAYPEKMQRYRDWLVNENAVTLSDGSYQLDITDPRMMFSSAKVDQHVERYALMGYSPGNPGWEQQFAFNTPYGAPADAICGRVAYSAFHVSAAGGSSITPFHRRTFPAYCDDLTGQSLNDQEKTLLYMLFDLAACVSEDGPPPPPSCEPVHPDECSDRCGSMPDGCGGIVECGACPDGQYCGSGNVCEQPECIKTTCEDSGATCGVIADGCDGTLDCGHCESGSVCGLLKPHECAPTCTPSLQATACESKCGYVSDGCGDVHACGGCPAGQACVAGECTSESCEPKDACPPDKQCGIISDGCDGTLDCGDCELPEVCGGGGVANVCGKPECAPLSCDDVDAECGWVGDGCGGSLHCGDCPPGQQCGLDGPNRCGGCQPRTCEDVDAECGVIGDGCGGTIDCGSCPGGEICGAEVANQCGEGRTCTPRTCRSLDAECGVIGDGCGDTVDCGECPPGQLCGIEQPFQCGDPPECEPTTCEALEAECGSIGNGCGGLIDCGACPNGFTCGRLQPNKCAPPPGPGPK